MSQSSVGVPLNQEALVSTGSRSKKIVEECDAPSGKYDGLVRIRKDEGTVGVVGGIPLEAGSFVTMFVF